MVGWLVQEQQIRRGEEHSGQRESRLLPAGEPIQRPLQRNVRQPQPHQELGHLVLGGISALPLEALFQLAVAREQRIQRVRCPCPIRNVASSSTTLPPRLSVTWLPSSMGVSVLVYDSPGVASAHQKNPRAGGLPAVLAGPRCSKRMRWEALTGLAGITRALAHYPHLLLSTGFVSTL